MNHQTAPSILAPLDPDFQPAAWFDRNYVVTAKKSGRAVPLVTGLERERKSLSRFEALMFPESDEATCMYVERLVNFLLWARGGWNIFIE